MARRLILLVLLATPTHAAFAQGAPQGALPPELVATFDVGVSWAENFGFPVPTQGGSVRCDVTFQNDTGQKSITCLWKYRLAGSTLKTMTQVFDVAFKPTYVCKRAGLTDTIYVIGWSVGTEQVLVQQWRFKDIALGTTVPPGGGASITTMTTPRVDKSVLWVSAVGSGIQPMRSIICNPYGNELWLFEYGFPAAVTVLDLEDNSLSPLFDQFQYPQLADAASLKAGMHENGDFVVIALNHPLWADPPVPKAGDPIEYFRAFYDTDQDGILEGSAVFSYDEFHAAYPPSSWVRDYQAP